MTLDPAAQAAFDELVARYAARPGITTGTAFASPGIRIDGHIFAMLQAGGLVLKLPADDGDRSDWNALADEALAFVR